MTWLYQPLLPGGAQQQQGVTHYTLTAAAGSYTLSDQAAALRVARGLSAASGSYTLSGQSADLIWSGAPLSAGGNGSGRIGLSLSLSLGL